MADSEIIFMSGSDLGPLLKARQLSPVEVVRAYLDRIDALEPCVQAFITVTREQALAQARQAEREIAAGRYRGPLHGLPYAPKGYAGDPGNPHHERLEDHGCCRGCRSGDSCWSNHGPSS